MVCQAAAFVGKHQHQPLPFPNWSTDVTFAPADYWEPEHSDDATIDGLTSLVDAVVEATGADQAIHALGSGWAFEDLAGSDGAMISLRNLDRQLHYVVGDDGSPGALTPDWRMRQDDPNSPAVLVHVEAGIRIARLSELLRDLGLAMPTLGGSNGQQLAGAISTSVHGGDWDEPPFPDFVRAIHLVGEGGQERWIEPSPGTRQVTASDAELLAVLPCAETEIVRDDHVFDAARVACGRFGVFYSLVLEVRRAFRVVEVTNRPARSDVLDALRTGVADGTLFAPVFALLDPMPKPAGVDDATGVPSFLQILFNSQDPEKLWAFRRWETDVAEDLPSDVVGGEDPSLLEAAAIVAAVDLALDTAIAAAQAIPVFGAPIAAYISLAVIPAFHTRLLGKTRLGEVLAAGLEAIWRVPLAGKAVPEINDMALGSRFNGPMGSGRRGPHYLMTSGTRAESDSVQLKSASIEVVFDATRAGYLDFLDEILPMAPRFRQAGYISLRPSRASDAHLSMHNVGGSHAMSIEIASVEGLPDNAAWMAYVQQRAMAYGGRPHWGQYNRLDALDVALLYGAALEQWREGLLSHSGTSTRFSNAFTQQRGLEPTAIAREVTATSKPEGLIKALCNPGASWSPVPRAQAVAEIESGTVRYFVRNKEKLTLVKVVEGKWLRTVADDTSDDNLDNLPNC